MKTILLLALILVLLAAGQRWFFSFAAQRPEDYAGTGPSFDIRTHLAGPLVSEGMIFGPRGRVVSRFVASMNGEWNGQAGTLSEDFSYANGGKQTRKWVLTMGERGHFTATADDIIGEGVGHQSGATVRITYRIRLPEGAGGHVLDVTDWLYLMENGTILNRSEMRKFGIKVAELVATIRPAP